MAVFQDTDLQRLDWSLLLHGPIALYYRPAMLAEDVIWLGQQGYLIHQFDCQIWQSHDDLHHALATELAFPDYYGEISMP